MSFNGSGTFLINSTGQPVVTGTVISSTVFNALTNDLASGLSNCITRDGQTSVAANIPMNGFKFTGLGDGSLATDSTNLGQTQSTVAKLIGSISGTNTITGTLTPAITAYAAGQMFYFIAAGANTGAVTLNINGLGAKAITTNKASALASGDIASGEMVVIVYDGTQFQMISAANSTVSAGGSNTQIQYNNSGALAGSANFTFDGSNVVVSGTVSSAAHITTGSTVPSNGIYLPSANTLGFSSNTTARGTVNSTGNWTINAPSSGVAVSATGAGANYVYFAKQATGSGFVTQDSGGTNNMSMTAGTVSYLTATNQMYLTAGGADRVFINSTGAVQINAPSSGVALTLNGFSTSNVLNVVTSPGSTPIQVSDGTATSWWFTNATSGVGFGTQTAHALSLYTNNTAKLQISSAGNVTINAPSSGTALTVNSVGGATSGLVITGVASQTGANISTTTPSGTTNYWRLGQPGIINWDLQNVATTGVFNITNGTYTPISAAPATGVSIGAPNANTPALVVNGSASTPANNIGNSGTAFTVDCSKSNVFYVTMTGNVAAGSMTISNMQDGQTINIYVTNGAGPYTLGNATGVKWPGGTVGTLTATNGAVDCITIQQVNSVKYATILKAFA